MLIQGTNVGRWLPTSCRVVVVATSPLSPTTEWGKKIINGGVDCCKHWAIELLSQNQLSTIHLLSLGLLPPSESWIIAISLGFFTPMTSTFKFLWQFHTYRTHLHHPFIVHDLKRLEDRMVFAQVYEKIYGSYNF